MNDLELAIVQALEPSTRRKAMSLIKWADDFLEGTPYRLSIPWFTVPWRSGNRTAGNQAFLYAFGRTRRGRIITNCDGRRKKSFHQSGKAIHFGLRRLPTPSNRVGRFVHHGTASSEGREVFLLVVKKAESLRLSWGGRWSRLKDHQHFELRP